MNAILLYGGITGAAITLVIFVAVRRLLQVNAYEKAVKAYLISSAHHCYSEHTMLLYYDERIMLACFDGGMRASTAARQMLAVHRET